MATEIDVINAALIRLGEQAITARTDANKRARIANATFDELRDTVLQDHTWNFAIRRMELPADPDAPAHGFLRAFKVPGDALRVIDVEENPQVAPGQLAGPPRSTREPWKVEQFEGARAIVTDLEAPLRVRVLWRTTDLSIAPPAFRDALAQFCAAQWAESITGTNTLKQDLLNEYVAKVSAARSLDGREGSLEKAFIKNSWLAER